jgi:hypothetical protein
MLYVLLQLTRFCAIFMNEPLFSTHSTSRFSPQQKLHRPLIVILRLIEGSSSFFVGVRRHFTSSLANRSTWMQSASCQIFLIMSKMSEYQQMDLNKTCLSSEAGTNFNRFAHHLQERTSMAAATPSRSSRQASLTRNPYKDIDYPQYQSISKSLTSSFTLSTSSTMLSFYSRGNSRKGYIRENWTNFTYFLLALFSLALSLAYQQGELHSNYGNTSSLFLGTASVTAAVATTLSTRSSRVGRPTMVSMSAGSSRTLIELSNQETDESGQFQIEVTYLDEDFEHGLLVLRRVNIIKNDPESTMSVMKSGRAVYTRVIRLLKNPIVAVVLAGNIAAMIGILPAGIAGFLPAVGIFLARNMKWVPPVLRRLSFGTASVQASAFKAVVSKLKFKLSKVISNLYKNRSKYSLVSDCLWYVDVGEEKGKHEKSIGDNYGGAIPSTYRAIA